jgi:hypothetical protein
METNKTLRKTYVDRNHNDVDITDDAKIINGINRGHEMIELDNGVWLESTDTAHYNGDNLAKYSEVIEGRWEEIDGQLEFIDGIIIGYIEI